MAKVVLAAEVIPKRTNLRSEPYAKENKEGCTFLRNLLFSYIIPEKLHSAQGLRRIPTNLLSIIKLSCRHIYFTTNFKFVKGVLINFFKKFNFFSFFRVKL